MHTKYTKPVKILEKVWNSEIKMNGTCDLL